MQSSVPLPSVIFLGAADYEVKEKKHFDLLGETLNDDALIKIKVKQAAATKRDTMLHEVLHAICWLSGYSHNNGLNHDSEEALVRTFTPWLLAALRDNPDLLAFLLEK